MTKTLIVVASLILHGIHFCVGYSVNVIEKLEVCNQLDSALCDPNGILTVSDGLRVESELITWESILTNLCPSCEVCSSNSDGSNTRSKVYILTQRQILERAFTRRDNRMVVTGKCANDIVVVFESSFMDNCTYCNLALELNKQEGESPSIEDPPLYDDLALYISQVMLWYYNTLVVKNAPGLSEHLSIFQKVGGRKFSCTVTSVDVFDTQRVISFPQTSRNSSADAVKDNAHNQFNISIDTFNSTTGEVMKDDAFIGNHLSVSAVNKSVTNETNVQHILTHHSHHGITNNILTIIACLLGSGAMSLLLCFRRVRHLLCSVCMVCRSADDFRSLLADPDA